MPHPLGWCGRPSLEQTDPLNANMSLDWRLANWMPLVFSGPQCQMSVAVCFLISEIIMSVLCLESPSVKKDLCGFWSITSVGTAVLSFLLCDECNDPLFGPRLLHWPWVDLSEEEIAGMHYQKKVFIDVVPASPKTGRDEETSFCLYFSFRQRSPKKISIF